jgi:putative transposase
MFPTLAQEIGLKKACGCARFAYNWALAEWKIQYEAGLKPTEGKLRIQLNAIKREKFPWMLESTKCAPQQAIKNLGTAYSKFFKKQAGYPKFKKKGQKDSFYIDNTHERIDGKKFSVPNIDGDISLSEALRFEGKILNYTASRDVDRWYVSVTVDTSHQLERKSDKGTVGIDLGIKTLATLSDGTTFDNPRFYKKALARIQRQSRALARKQKGSRNREKSKVRLAKTHRKVRLSRLDSLHQLTTYVAINYTTVVIEDLNVSGMVKNHNLAASIQDAGFGMFRSMLIAKCDELGTRLVVADRWFASSKICSNCGNKKTELKLSTRIYRCDVCNSEMNRDLNAAINLKKLGACCPEVKPVDSS